MLLDTSALLWVLEDSPRLGRSSRERLSAASQVRISSISIAEIEIKSMLGKLTVSIDLPSQLAAAGLVALPFSIDDAKALRAFPELNGHDPFDRMLVAQAEANGLEFLTSDRRLLALGRVNILDATS